jgi:hypothetical protein
MDHAQRQVHKQTSLRNAHLPFGAGNLIPIAPKPSKQIEPFAPSLLMRKRFAPSVPSPEQRHRRNRHADMAGKVVAK